jgi:FtsP/CotA-like multicopper oxidase with cupredoxin domain
MRGESRHFLIISLLLVSLVGVSPAGAAVFVQCPGDTNGDAQWTGGEVQPPNAVCLHITGGDGFAKMADGSDMYVFGFSDVRGVLPADVMNVGELAANISAPTITVKEGQNVYLNLSNVGMKMRPDLFDPHTVHFHGFPNAASVFDGEPMASISINQGTSLTYYYTAPSPGTYMYHCHVEATEHMQMGMLGNLYVTPLQDGTPIVYQGKTYTKFAYNDGDGSTGYDVNYPIQITAFDPLFHDADLNIQPLPFAAMQDTYPMLNGRGYPDTVNTADILNQNGHASQKTNALITATVGQKVLLRISSLSTVDFHTVRVLGIPMKVVGKDAKILRSSSGQNLYYDTSSVTLGGGESVDVILDTTNVPAGTYFFYVTNLEHLSNNQEDFGGMMTEIIIN